MRCFKTFLAVWFMLFFQAPFALGQTFSILPYLQDASPHEMGVLWETSAGEESIVEWGLTADNLENTASGISFSPAGTAFIHDVKITGLERFTTYFYRVKTGPLISEVYRFKTPPFASDDEDFRFVAMSDMQQSAANPNVFDEIIHEGVLDYLQSEYGGEPTDNLALVLIPGDLVDYGDSYEQWQSTFFEPAEDLFAQIPVYPVLGNHEVNTNYYFQYFHLPENGTPGFEEHWWWKDYGNVRFVGLDSNAPYDGELQVEWLEELLESTCDADSIDFVFAELHHPYKSELWTPGESDFTGQVIELLEGFTESCGKPSIHFFGHTHGYSRGQSKDHKHLWINVATAGGAIDYWGDWPQFDYDEFQTTTDDWGFVMVDVTAGEQPSFTVNRLSRGDNNMALDNVVTDRFTITKAAYEVTAPTPISIVDQEVPPECVFLSSSPFEGAADQHGETEWQVSEIEEDFSQPVASIWERFENIYFNEDTQEGASITDEQILGLSENTSFWWRVRYRDKELNWSDWSVPAAFSTGESGYSQNLLRNPGSETELVNWVIDEGIVESQLAGDCAGTNPYSGDRYFAVGGLCTESAVGRMHQDVDVTAYADSIDAGGQIVRYGAMMSNWNGSDLPEMRLSFYSSNGETLGTTAYLPGNYTTWTLVSESIEIPLLTRMIRSELRGTRYAGTDNDSYVDDVFVQIGSESACDPSTSGVNDSSYARVPTKLIAYPNPGIDAVLLDFKFEASDAIVVRVSDAQGRKIQPSMELQSNKIILYRGSLPRGMYYVSVIGQNGSLATSTIIFE